MFSLRAACVRVALRPASLPRVRSLQTRNLHVRVGSSSQGPSCRIPRTAFRPHLPSPTSAIAVRAFSLFPSSAPAPFPPKPPNVERSVPDPTAAASSSPPPPVDTTWTAPSPPPTPETTFSDAPFEVIDHIDPSSWPTLHFGDLAELGLGMSWTPASWGRELFEIVAATTGLPMWASVIVFTIALRVALLPLAIQGQRVTARMAVIQPQMKVHQDRIKESYTKGDMVAASFEQRHLKVLMDAGGFKWWHPFKYPVAQAFAGITSFFALRSMSLHPVPQLLEGGTAWFPDLTAAGRIFTPWDQVTIWAPWTWFAVDSLWGLPMIATAVMYANIKYGGDIGVNNPQVQNMRDMAGMFVVLFAAVTFIQPQAVCLYFTVNNLFLLLQSTILNAPPVRRALGLPKPPPPEPSTKPVEKFSLIAMPGKIARWLKKREEEGRASARERQMAAMLREQQRLDRLPKPPTKWESASPPGPTTAAVKQAMEAKRAAATVHEQVKEREIKAEAHGHTAAKAGKTDIVHEGRQQRARGKHMR